MLTSYGIEVDNAIIGSNITRISGQIFRLLPVREEGKDWEKPLETLIVELLGMNSLLEDQKDLFTLVCKLEGLKADPQIDFMLYRRTIFECCSLAMKVRDKCL